MTDPLRAARGIVYGIGASAVLWLLLAAIIAAAGWG
jgi:hypothetical protein